MIRLRSLFIIALVINSCGPETMPDQASYTVNEEINRIEKSLKPQIQIEGESVPIYSIEERMEFYAVPNISVALIEKGVIRWAKGYGLADPNKGTTVDEKTLFQAASISKPVAALGVLKLVQEGRLDLDTDVNQYLTSWKVPTSKFTRQAPVTLRGILTHTAGVTVHGFPGYRQSDDFPSDIEVLNGAGNTGGIYVDTFPRSIYRYSGGGYTIMERVVEDVTGEDFADFMQKAVLAPSGMERSTYEQPLPAQLQEKISLAFHNNGEVYEGGWHNYPEQAAAGLWTNPTDLARFAIQIQQSIQGKKGSILSKELAKQMLKKDKLGHGLGPALDGQGDALVFMHGGKNAGFSCHLFAYANQGKGVAVMSGADGAHPLIREIQMAIAEEYGWDVFQPRVLQTIEQPEEVLKKRVGTYHWPERDYQVLVTLRDGYLHLVDPNEKNKEYPLRSKDQLTMIDLVDGDDITFVKGKSGAITGFYQNGNYFFEKLN